MAHRAPTTVRPLLIALCLLLPAARLPAATPLGYKPHKQGRFIMALARRPDGVVFVGTEDHGIWAFHPTRAKSHRWTHFTAADGLGDNHIYALAVDHRGRVWAGHLNHGVSVYNGKTWRNYDRTTGPLGERVFDIAVAPAPPGSAPAPGNASGATSGGAAGGGGDVWIATDAGLTRYSPAKDTWSYLTRADGLPSNQIEAIAFGPRGTLYAATQCHGLAIASPKKHYQSWRTVTSRFTQKPSAAPTGSGLPSNLLNDVMVGGRGRVWVATDAGIAWSNNGGRSFTYLRGKDWLAKLKGLYHAPSHSKMTLIKSHWRGRKVPTLSEDYTTCLAQDADGRVWIGHRQRRFDVLQPTTGEILTLDKPPPPGQDDVTAILPAPGQAPILGFYHFGLRRLSKHYRATGQLHPHALSPKTPALPAPAAPPTAKQLRGLLTRVRHIPAVHRGRFPLVVAMDDDWRTEGDWLGRRGKYWACLSAICGPSDYLWGAGAQRVDYHMQIGPHHRKNDSLRYWVHWLHTNKPDVLTMPPTYLDSRIIKGYTTAAKPRRQASCDDHGEKYPQNYDGPHVYCTLSVPSGRFMLSLYFYNKDGHGGENRFRDYHVLIHPHPRRWPLNKLGPVNRLPVLAQARVHQFWHGVYKQFLAQGPAALTIEINSNYSYDTIVSGIFLDSLDPTPPPYFTAAQLQNASHDREENSGVTDSLFSALRHARRQNPRWWAIHAKADYTMLLRYDLSLSKAKKSNRLHQIGVCDYRLQLFPQWEATLGQRGLRTARSIEKSIRWTKQLQSCSGHGRMIVKRYLAKQ